MTDLIIKNEYAMTSVDVAELTGKQHKNVMRDIRVLLEQGVQQLNFELSSYSQKLPNGGTKDVPMYQLTPKGCLILASGYDALLREKIINRLEEWETGKRSFNVPQTFADALQLAANQQRQLEHQQKLIEEQKPKAEYADKVLSAPNCWTTTIIAKELGMSAIALNKKLAALGIQYKQRGVWNLSAGYDDKGYTHTRTVPYSTPDGSIKTTIQTEWTEKGRQFLHGLKDNNKLN